MSSVVNSRKGNWGGGDIESNEEEGSNIILSENR